MRLILLRSCRFLKVSPFFTGRPGRGGFRCLLQHLIRRFPLRYDPLYWGAVFPLGMYAVATKQMAATQGLPFLAALAPAFFVVALAAWMLTFIGLARELVHQARRTAT